ncbi:MAG: hypothetical protein A2186_01115 [Candidatus Levybacteria bacterium RIFOXYA1_FULL_41_10]|nr:MAG: hypothetical protein UT46_C0009G0002 [Candidatus Levybacteria bacterium GW2011_GWA1_39_34]KKR51449.1 MAG: hypothetical protein UT87_C0006G0029 [Candidatus Levybacteria bacterium GW2011_GWC1_40_19]KKR94854.1 MAG: hypothetical protein UU45_C0006G0016 [Candidatus Levybacteria bacterium GW2011_GWA2_41_15]KKS01485.1 MAG: hypothetical protein UU52_C0011G0002 [Candidatus Levybacteria bacterium GW2011_GWB1_41_21]OGH21187.1 MAG: hypothetical protein A2695_00820 [Candidatus Levybacteria bacterium
MKLPNLPIGQNKKESSYYLSLTLRDDKASAVILEETARQARIVGFGEEKFKDSIETAETDEILQTLDKAISSAEENLPKNVETHNTIFAVKDSWVMEGKIKPEYLEKLKKASDELGLKPVGFLIITEALLHLLQIEDGAPVSAVLAEVGPKRVSISLVRAGKIIEQKSSEIHESAAFTTNILLKHLTTPEVLPSKIIVYDADERLEQEFLNFSWSKSLPFLHPPQIKALSINYDAKAVVYGAVNQMKFILSMESLKNITFQKPIASIEDFNYEEFSKEEPGKTIVSDNLSSDFGFMQDHDIAGAKAIETKDASSFSEKVSEIPDDLSLRETTREMPVKAMEILGEGKKVLGSFFKNLKPMLSKITSKGGGGGRKRLIVPGIIAFVVFSFLLFYLFATKATITLQVDKKSVSQNETITFTAEGETNPTENVLSGRIVTVTEEGKLSTDSTGKKETGDKAKGSVTIFNNNDASKTLEQGTKLTSANGLEFVTDKKITVASASGDVFSGTKPGTEEVGVTAVKFGTNYNQPSNTKFSVEGSNSIAAKNDNPFSGGTKKDLIVVSQKDIDKLLKELPKTLEGKARKDIQTEVSEDEELLSVFVTTKFERKTFSKDVDDEATQVALTAVIQFQGIAYKTADLLKFAKANLEEDIDEKLTINEDDIEIGVKNIKTAAGGDVSANLDVTANLVPKIQEKDLINELSGKPYGDARKILEKLPNVSSVEISQSPPIPLLPKFLPRSGKNIKLVIEIQ